MLKALWNALLRLRMWARLSAGQEAKRLQWGYEYCRTDSDRAALEYLYAVKLLRDQQLSTGVCICSEEIDTILSAAAKAVGPECGGDTVLDFSRGERADIALWLLQNPGCISYETWAEHLAAMCRQLDVDTKIIELKCEDLGLDIKVAEKVACSQVELLLEIEQKSCVVGIDITAEAYEACKVTAVTEVVPKTCGLSLSAAVRALSCGMDVGTLVAVFGCDLSLNPVVIEESCAPPTPTPCVVTAYCSENSPADCDLMVAAAQEDVGVALNTTNQLALPAITLTGCSGCGTIEIPRSAWGSPTIEGVFPDEYAVYTLSLADWLPGPAQDLPSQWANLLAADCVALETLNNLVCINECNKDLGCETVCADSHLANNTLCYINVPTYDAACAALTYSATLTIPFHYNAAQSSGYTAPIQCGSGPISADYIERTATIEDSLGNELTCTVRRYNMYL